MGAELSTPSQVGWKNALVTAEGHKRGKANGEGPLRQRKLQRNDVQMSICHRGEIDSNSGACLVNQHRDNPKFEQGESPNYQGASNQNAKGTPILMGGRRTTQSLKAKGAQE